MAGTAQRDLCARNRWAAFALLALALVFATPARAQVPITLFQSFAGNVDFTGFGNTLRAASDAVNPCTVVPNSSATLTLPPGATVQTAYLYWSGSGAAVDSNVTFGGFGVTASRTFTETFTLGATSYPFFAGFADVTAIVTGPGAYTFAGLTVNQGAPFCGSSAVLSGWNVIVVYSSPAEPNRVVNLYDGFRFFRGSSIGLVATNFLTPTPLTAADTGRHAHLTWEGDAGNSGALGGVSENLLFGGNPLTDVNNPLNNQFNSTVNTVVPVNTTAYGVDFDAYNITPFLTPGQSSATTTYSSGQDLVLLSAEIFSVPNVPIADLSIAKSHVGDFSVGSNHFFTIDVTNNGPAPAAGPITVTDTLPAGLTYVSGTGGSWACGAVGQDVTCTHPGPLASTASLASLTLTVSVGAAAFPSVANTASVSAPDFDNQAANDSSTDNVTVIGPDLSTSTKTVVDLNGGDANPGDTLRYTITLIESGGVAATGVSVTDDVPANVVNFNVTSTPAGSTNSSTGPPTGANTTGFVNVTGITVPASGSVTVVFEVDVAPATPPGTLITNTATITNPNGPGATPAAPNVTVSASSIPGTGTKMLYTTDNTSAPVRQLTRVPPGAQNFVEINGNNTAFSWVLNPAVVAGLQLNNVPIPVELWLVERGPGSFRTVQVQLFNGAALIGTVALGQNLPNGAPVQIFFNVPNAVLQNVPIGGTLTMTVTNQTAQNNRRIRVFPTTGANFSRVHAPANTIINVDSVDGYDAVYPGGVIPPTFAPGNTVFVRASVSDPFGDFDITGAQLVIVDPLGTPLAPVAMVQVTPAGIHPKVYEFAYAIPAAGPAGIWTTRVTATEGLEAVPLTDLGVGIFVVVIPMPNIVVLKTVQTNPPGAYHLPGTDVTYTIRVTNMGPGTVDLDTLVITDAIPAELEFRSADFDGVTSGPIRFDDGTTASGLGYSFVLLTDMGDDVGFQDTTSAPLYTYVPATPYDGNVIAIQINPKGVMNGNGGGTDPFFEVHFKARVR